MTSNELRNRFLDFFKSKGHTIIPSASLVPENDPTVLFTTAGMHPLVPFLLGQPHPAGKRLTNAQKCLRTDDIDEVGDDRHNTFFEMLGNWSFGDYFKREAIEWSFEFLTSKQWLGLNPQNLFVSVFEGDKDAPRDNESIAVWQSVFKTVGIEAKIGERIFLYPKKKNWWGPAGITGPCGPCTEMFYFTGKEHNPSLGDACHINCDCGRYLEIWNDVFMEYEKKLKVQSAKSEVSELEYEFIKLKKKNVDTGMGLERISKIFQEKESVYETDLFEPIINEIKNLPPTQAERSIKGVLQTSEEVRSQRIIADHIRAATFLIADGVKPSNVERGYIVRRLIRRAIRYGLKLKIANRFTHIIATVIIKNYSDAYKELRDQEKNILLELSLEEEKFSRTLAKGLKKLEEIIAKHENAHKFAVRTRPNFGSKHTDFINAISGKDAFDLYQNYGFPFELIQEELAKHALFPHEAEFKEEFTRAMQKHQELSRAGSEQKFKGGMADHSEVSTRYHTATHLLHQALRDVLGYNIFQKGSNITAERMRFDFSHPQKMSPEEIKEAEEIVNEKIIENLNVRHEVRTVEEAKSMGAIGLFEGKYGENVSVYSIGEFSKEICGGPHVKQTGEIGKFKIIKEEAVSAGIRRIKAVIE